MELLVLFAVIVFSILGMCITSAMKAAWREAERVGDALVAESRRVQAVFDQLVQQALVREAQKPQTNEPVERLVFRMETRRR